MSNNNVGGGVREREGTVSKDRAHESAAGGVPGEAEEANGGRSGGRSRDKCVRRVGKRFSVRTLRLRLRLRLRLSGGGAGIGVRRIRRRHR